MERNNSEIPGRSYPVLIIIAACLVSAVALTSARLLRSVSPGFTPEGRECVKAVREHLKRQNPPVRHARVRIDGISPINDLGRYTDPEWKHCDALKDSLYAVIRNVRPELRDRKEYLSLKQTELMTATEENRDCVEEQVGWLERLQQRNLDGNVMACLHERAWSLERKSMELMREPGRRIDVTVTSRGRQRKYVFVSPAGAVVLTDIASLDN